METSLKNLILAGIGTVAYTYEKSTALVEELVKKGELTVSQGKQLNEELKRKSGAGKANEKSDNPVTMDMLKEIISGLNLATKQDIDELRERINALESK